MNFSKRVMIFLTSIVFLFISFCSFSQNIYRKSISLNNNWHTVANDSNINAFIGFEIPGYNIENWEKVNIPHNWDKYEGYRRLKHGNRHGYAWYRKEFIIQDYNKNKQYFLFFEGVGSYAHVWLNGKKVGYHAGGKTTFTIDITDFINRNNQPNILAVRADHPAGIKDLPWVCGGCSDEIGFCEGSEPLGIYRPVSLIITGKVRIEPFGVHIWNDTTVNEKLAELNISTEIKNYSNSEKDIILNNRFFDKYGNLIKQIQSNIKIQPNSVYIEKDQYMNVEDPILWSIENPYLYTLETEIIEHGKTIDLVQTKYGIRWISWPIFRNNGDNRFYLNGKPVFINGTAEYEHNFGNSHAFTEEQIRTHVEMMKSAGFNAFRDAHQPHNLRFQHYWDSLGILFWTQMTAHIWFDNDSFKTNFKQLLREFVKERRNCPSVILWGLENESTLPTWFAEECTQIIREMDPTSPCQRLVTTCNGGTGTDWNVVQNWSGTYAGDLFAYDKDITKELLNGEYGAWRSLDMHTEGDFEQSGPYSENRMCQLMEIKVRLAEKAKDSCCGQFQWIFNTHDNPGRVQNGEGFREIDRIGPVNYKGLITPWGEPADVYFMYRANYAPKKTEPMVYIVSHTWPNRWTNPGIKNGITVYSNCDEVELFNDINSQSLGKRTRNGIGTHFKWDSVNIQYNVLYAKGFVNRKVVAEDVIVLHSLPESPNFKELTINAENITIPEETYHYICRVNCGGSEFTDQNGNIWMADQQKTDYNSWGSKSWTDDFEGLPVFYGSQRRTFDPISNTKDWKLFQNFRYGRDKLNYHFSVPDGEYLVELYFIEPWYSANSSSNCEGWRLFDVAMNDEIVIDDLDIYKETGHDKVFKKTIKLKCENGEIKISFPEVKSGQAVISAIAIASLDEKSKAANSPKPNIVGFSVSDKKTQNQFKLKTWADIGGFQYSDSKVLFNELPPILFASDWIQTPLNTGKLKNEKVMEFLVSEKSDVFIALDTLNKNLSNWLHGYTNQNLHVKNDKGDVFNIYGKRFEVGEKVEIGQNLNGSMYTIFVNPVTNLGYASDQRPKTRYQAEEANLKGEGLLKEDFNREYIKFSRSEGDTIVWEFTVGLGDTYTLQFIYLNNSEQNIPMKLKIVDMYGVIVRDDIIEFTPRFERWRTHTTTTGTQINAGKYKVYLNSVGIKGLGIDRMDVQ